MTWNKVKLTKLASGLSDRTHLYHPIFFRFLKMSAQFVKTVIASDRNVVFSKTYCGYCAKAKRLLDSKGIKYTVIELDKRQDGNEIQNALYDMTKQSTVPNIFLDAKHIGGSDKLARLVAQGQL